MIKQVLVAVDGSDNSWKALDFALDFAEKYSAALEVLNVSESSAVVAVLPQVGPEGYVNESSAAMARDLWEFHEEIINRARTHVEETKSKVQTSFKLREGEAATEIAAEAKDGAFDVVVVGHAGTGRMKEFLGLGGISEKVAHTAPCPVIIVR
ncbi:MAG: universal stress protein [Candidatus Bathyarchaeota archaeon]|nr:universal stress protein [Candidatus Bathyarchaeota archaeon]